MSRSRSDLLTIGVGAVLVAMGTAETVRVLVSGDGVWALAFWSISLVGGGTLVLLGRLLYHRRPWLAFTLVTLGCVAGANATLWTLVIPLAAIAVVALGYGKAKDIAEQPHRVA